MCIFPLLCNAKVKVFHYLILYTGTSDMTVVSLCFVVAYWNLLGEGTLGTNK